jgi:lipopolysaccharide/colanic/teichoic acid biosynthesis glycosyltransferase
VLAVLIRDNFIPYESHLLAVTAYMAIAVATAAPIFVIAGLHTRLWQYTSLIDFLQIMGAVTVALLAAVSISFVTSRLEFVARSVPVIQWFLLVGAMVGTRVGVRIWSERKRRDRHAGPHASLEQVLVVGISHLTELYLQSVAEYASKRFDIVGILSEQAELRGRSLRFHEVLGTPEELLQVVNRLEVHGVALDRIVVMQSAEELSRRARDALLTVEQSTAIRVDWLVESLGLTVTRGDVSERGLGSLQAAPRNIAPSAIRIEEPLSLGGYRYVKRVLDLSCALLLSLVLAPLTLVISLLVALDVGFPIVFWQMRPGKLGRPFKLFKFCTMRAAHDSDGRRIPDEERSSGIGLFLRRTRLDELPQLFNIVVGEMSFIGPRPLLQSDQPEDMQSRLCVRPGITGFAQVYGDRDMPADDKNTLDIWYIQNASLWLDIKILIRTLLVFVRGERVDHDTLQLARKGLERLRNASGVGTGLTPAGAAGSKEVEIVRFAD